MNDDPDLKTLGDFRTGCDDTLLNCMRGAMDMLRASARHHRLNGDKGHANMCDMHAGWICRHIDQLMNETNGGAG